MPLLTFTTCPSRVSKNLSAVIDCRHVSWDGRRLLVISKYDVLRV